MLERKTDEEIAVEKAAGRMNDYPVFMAVADHIGHDKRGNVIYVRDKKGNEIVEEIEETFKEYEDGKPVSGNSARGEKLSTTTHCRSLRHSEHGCQSKTDPTSRHAD